MSGRWGALAEFIGLCVITVVLVGVFMLAMAWLTVGVRMVVRVLCELRGRPVCHSCDRLMPRVRLPRARIR